QIPLNVWQRIAHGHWDDSELWATNDLVIGLLPQPGDFRSIELRYFGIRFDPIGLQKMLPSSDRSVTSQALQNRKTNSKGGRPRKDFWDDLLIAIFARIYRGDLKPKSQADIEKAMLDWASANGHELGETSVKTPARKLYS